MDNRAFVKMDMGLWQEAIEDFQISMSVNPESVLCEFSIGECYLKMKEYIAAKEQFEKALSIDPNDKRSLEFLGKTDERIFRRIT
jgi:tetratricopeptide (TPR) repeat protein